MRNERGCSQFSTSAGEISGEDDSVNDYRLLSQPGLTMNGFVDDAFFDIVLSELDEEPSSSNQHNHP